MAGTCPAMTANTVRIRYDPCRRYNVRAPMSLQPPHRKPLRVLLSEGSSTSAREALTVLAGQGHEVEFCDPDAHCLTRFSRLAARFHRCPGLRDDPIGYLAF